MGNYDDGNSFVYIEQKEDSINYANLAKAENISPEEDDVLDIQGNYNLFNFNHRGILTSSISEIEIIENREFKDFFQDIDPEKFSHIFLEQNLKLPNDNHIPLFSVKQNFKSDSKEVISDNALLEISNIHKTVINSVLADDLTTALSLRKPCSLDDI